MLWFNKKGNVAYFDHIFWSEFKQAAPEGGKASLHFLSRNRKKILDWHKHEKHDKME